MVNMLAAVLRACLVMALYRGVCGMAMWEWNMMWRE